MQSFVPDYSFSATYLYHSPSAPRTHFVGGEMKYIGKTTRLHHLSFVRSRKFKRMRGTVRHSLPTTKNERSADGPLESCSSCFKFLLFVAVEIANIAAIERTSKCTMSWSPPSEAPAEWAANSQSSILVSLRQNSEAKLLSSSSDDDRDQARSPQRKKN